MISGTEARLCTVFRTIPWIVAFTKEGPFPIMMIHR